MLIGPHYKNLETSKADLANLLGMFADTRHNTFHTLFAIDVPALTNMDIFYKIFPLNFIPGIFYFM